MSTTTTTHETVSEAPTADPRPTYLPIGTDGEGAHHVYRTIDESVHVINDGKRIHREDLGERSVNEWLAYVADVRGWTEQHLYVTPGEAIADSIGGGLR